MLEVRLESEEIDLTIAFLKCFPEMGAVMYKLARRRNQIEVLPYWERVCKVMDEVFKDKRK